MLPLPWDIGLPSALGRDLGGLALPVACGPDIRTHRQHKNPCRAQGPTPDARLSRSWAAPGVCFLTGLRAPPWWTLERSGARVPPSGLSLIVYECPERAELMVFSSFLTDWVSRSWVY